MTKELEAALSAAKEAGEVLRKGFGWQHSVRYKGEVDLVTEVDEQAEQVIREILLGAFPAYGILAEEGGEQTGEEDARWIVDPLDGTTNYAHGLPIFCVSLALERLGEVVLGVVYDPIREEAYVAERGGGATLNGEPIRVSDTDELIQALIATGFPYDRPKMPEALELFGRFAAITRGRCVPGVSGARLRGTRPEPGGHLVRDRKREELRHTGEVGFPARGYRAAGRVALRPLRRSRDLLRSRERVANAALLARRTS